MDALRSSYFVIIPQTLRNDDSLSLNAKLLYGDIVALANDKGYCFASNAALADRLRLTERSISRLLAALEEAGLLTQPADQRMLLHEAVGELQALLLALPQAD